MKTLLSIAALISAAYLVQPAVAQQDKPAKPATEQAQSAPSPADIDKQVEKMQSLLAKMDEQMAQIDKTSDPKARQKLLEEHWATMSEARTLMRGAWGCCGAGMGRMQGNPPMGRHPMGGMMGGPMMWGEYQNLTPEQLKQRQYMMERWWPMQQMMMDHMMQHQHWMMPGNPAAPSAPPSMPPPPPPPPK